MYKFTAAERSSMARWDALVDAEPVPQRFIDLSESIDRIIWEMRHPERVVVPEWKRRANARYTEAHRAELAAYRAAHKAEIAARKRAWYQANRERIKRQQSQYRQTKLKEAII